MALSASATPPAIEVVATTYHDRAIEDVFTQLETGPDGLSGEEARARIARYGLNVLPRAKRRGLFSIYFSQFRSAFIYLLLAATLVTVALGEYGDALFILFVLQLNALIGTYQEWRAQQRVDALEDVVPNWVLVRRSAELSRVRSEHLVPGDLVLVESGVRIPADIRVTSARALKVDESLLTGESVPVSKQRDRVVSADAPIGDRFTMLHAGTIVTTGRGEGIVVATGARTEVGRIAEALARPDDADPPLLVRMARFTRTVATAMMVVIALIALVEALRGMPVAEIFLVSVALAVAAIPEGLPVAMTIALSISVSRMAKRSVVVRRLFAVEGLGACTLIASDKTGTLTCNELTARRVVLPELGELSVSGEGYEVSGKVSREGQPAQGQALASLRALAQAGALASEGSLSVLPEGRVTPLGDTVDAAFHVLFRKVAPLVPSSPETPGGLPDVTSRVPYEPEQRYGASFYRRGGQLRVAVKGAPETVLAMCESMGSGCALELGSITREMDQLARSGFRVLAVAEGAAEGEHPDHIHGLCLLGLVGLMDPLRPEAPAAVAACVGAGVDVRMITGDHPTTALAIAREIGLAQHEAEVVTGSALAQAHHDPEGFDAIVRNAKVFARIEPLQKLQIVEALKRAGHYVAVTGDGVNDAPALHVAHIGAAMGRSGTDVARQASDLILADDNFASIVGGIEEGRVAYGNIRKVIYLLISTGSAEIALFLLSLAMGFPVPLSAVQLLWLNLATQGAQHVGLAFEKAEPGILEQPPRSPAQGIFDRAMIGQTLVSGLWMGSLAFGAYAWLLSTDRPQEQVANQLLLLMVLFENAHVFSCRSETRSIFALPFFGNWILLAGVSVAQGLHILAMYVPGLRDVLEIAPVGFSEWLNTLLVAASVIVVMEVYKWVIRRHPDQGSSALRPEPRDTLR